MPLKSLGWGCEYRVPLWGYVWGYICGFYRDQYRDPLPDSASSTDKMMEVVFHGS